MKTSAKLGLVGTALYATTLAAPVYAAVKEEIKPEIIQPINIETIVTVEQADNLYKEKLIEYSLDKIIKTQELANLSTIQQAKKDLLTKEKENLQNEYAKIEDKIRAINQEIYNNIGALKDGEDIDILADVRSKFDKGILRYYPALLSNEKGNLTYSAETPLQPELNIEFKNILVEANKILMEYYKDDGLKIILSQDQHNLNNVLAFHNLITDKKSFSDEVKEENLRKKINVLEEEESNIINSEESVLLKKKISELESALVGDSQILVYSKNYFDHKMDTEDFKSKFGDFRKYFAVSIAKIDGLDDEGLERWLKERETEGNLKGFFLAGGHFRDNQKKIMSNLESYFKAEGFDVKIEKLENPGRTKIPGWFLSSLGLGLVFPIMRNIVVKKYVKGKETSGEEYGGTIVAGAINGIAGMIVLDSLHPLVYPVRMITPLVFQPLFKLLKIDPCASLSEALF